MGYTTVFRGHFSLDRPLTPEEAAYLHDFARTRRVRRESSKTELRPDPVRTAVGLPVGIEGGYFVGETGFCGQDNGPDVIDFNNEPAGQPGLWCQWVPGKDNQSIVWNDHEKFYFYTEWLAYLLHHFLIPWGYDVSGSVDWQGEEEHDIGTITVMNNAVWVTDSDGTRVVSCDDPPF